MTMPVADPVDVTPSTTAGWIDAIKQLTRPAGCWCIYGCTVLLIVGVLVLAYLKITLDTQTVVSLLGFLGAGWAHVYQYTWARSAEKVANAD